MRSHTRFALCRLFTAMFLVSGFPCWSAAAPSAPPPDSGAAYTDERGQPILLPADPADGLAEIERAVRQREFRNALDLTGTLLLHPALTREQRGELLHRKAELAYAVHGNDPTAHLEAIIEAGMLAVHYNPHDPRNADVYLRLGEASLKAGNIPEARGYFAQLR